MNIEKRKVPSTLYHYTTKEVLIEKILPQLSLKVGSFKKTNDPRENKFSAIAPLYKGEVIFENNILGRAVTFFEEIRFDEWNVLCLSMDAKQSNEISDSYKKEMESKFILGSSHARMWSQYSSNHTGACLVLDGEALLSKFNNVLVANEHLHHGPIVYDNGSTEELNAYQLDLRGTDIENLSDKDLLNNLREHVAKYHSELFLRKFTDWQSENEYRFLINSLKHEDIKIDIKGVLKSIILGTNFNKNYYPSVIDITRQENIEVYRIDWQNRCPTLYSIS